MPQMHKEYELAQSYCVLLVFSSFSRSPYKNYLLERIAMAILLKQLEHSKIDIVHMATISMIGKFTCSFFFSLAPFVLVTWSIYRVGLFLCCAFGFFLRISTKVSEGAVGICVICGTWLNFDGEKNSIDEHEPLLLIRNIQPELLSNRRYSIRFGKYSIRFFPSHSKIANFDMER